MFSRLFLLVSSTHFFESAAGLILLAVAIGMQIAGISLVRRLLKVEVA